MNAASRVGRLVGDRWRLVRHIGGEGWEVFEAEGGYRVTLAASQQREHGRLMHELGLPVPGVVPLSWIGRFEAGLDALVEGPLPGAPVAVAPGALARRVAAVHAEGLVLGGLRPEAVFAAGGEVVLAPRSDPFAATAGPSEGQIPPFPGVFAAPEVLAGEPASAASDVFSLAATAWSWLTGAPPFPGATPAAQAMAILTGQRPPPPSGFPAILAAALAFDPIARPTADELARALG